MIQNFLAFFKPGRFLRNFTAMLFGNLSTQGIMLLTTPILTRLFSPADFGLLTLLTALIGCVSIFMCGRLEQAIVIAEEESEAFSLLGICILMAIVLFLGLHALGPTLYAPIARFFNHSGISRLLFLVPLGALALALKEVFVCWATREKAFERIALSNFCGGVIAQCVKIGAGIFGGGALWLVAGNIAGFIGAALLLLSHIGPRLKSLRMNFSPTPLLKLIHRNRSFPQFGMPTDLINFISQQIPVFFLGFYFNPAIVGFFGLANTVLKKPIQTIARALSGVFLQKLTQAPQVTHRTLLVKSTGGLFFLGLVPFGILLLKGEFLFDAFFGPEWRVAGRYCEILVPWLFIAFLNPPAMQILIVRRQLRFKFGLECFSILLRIFAFIFGFYFYVKAEACLILFGIAGIVSNGWLIVKAYQLTGSAKGETA